MSFKVTLPSPVTITHPEKGGSITTTELNVVKTIDFPGKKQVAVVINGAGKHFVQALSGTAYDSPQWTNESLSAALVTQKWS
jgi:hypothetical protein